MLAQQEGAEQVHVHHALPLFGGGVFRRRNEADAGVVHERIGRTAGGSHMVRQRLHEGFGRNIAREPIYRMAGGAQFAERGIQRLQVRQDHVPALLGEEGGSGKAHALGGASNNNGTSHVHPLEAR